MLKLTLRLFALILCGCDTRAPESALFGTWRNTTPTLDQATFYRFGSDHSFSVSFDRIDDLKFARDGKWYAGGPNIYLRFTGEAAQGQRPLVLHIVEVSKDEIRVRWSKDGAPVILRRVAPSPKAFNHTMEQITNCCTTFSVIISLNTGRHARPRSPRPIVFSLGL
jgi:hypothetical protein